MPEYLTYSQEVVKGLHKHLRCTKQRQESKRMFQIHLRQIHTPTRSQEISEIDETTSFRLNCIANCLKAKYSFKLHSKENRDPSRFT